jgi:hypothetical protein
MNKNDIANQSIKLFNFSFLIFNKIESTTKNQTIAQAREKL